MPGTVCSRFEPVLLPAVDDQANISVAHGKTLQGAETVVYQRSIVSVLRPIFGLKRSLSWFRYFRFRDSLL